LKTQAAPDVRQDWKTVFNTIATAATLDTASQHFAPGVSKYLGTTQEQAMAAPARELGRIIQFAERTATRFSNTGLLDVPPYSGLDMRVTEANVGLAVSAASGFQQSLDRKVNNYSGTLQNLLSTLLDDAKNLGDGDVINQRLKEARQQLQDLNDDLEGLRKAAEQEDQHFSDVATEYQRVLEAHPGDTDYAISASTGIPPALSIAASDARYQTVRGAHDEVTDPALGDVAVQQPNGQFLGMSAPAGSTLQLTVSGTWSPSCAIQHDFADQHANAGFDADPAPSPDNAPAKIANAYTGPDGYVVHEIQDQKTAYSKKSSDQKPGAICSKDHPGDNRPVPSCDEWTVYGPGVSEEGDFVAGFRTRYAPFVSYPAGSLLLVEVTAGADKNNATGIRAIHVLHPENAFTFDSGVDLYFVVNDFKGSDPECPVRGTLTLHPRLTIPQGKLVSALGNAMKSALTDVHRQAPKFVSEGHFTPLEAASLRSKAIVDLNNALPSNVDDLSKFQNSLQNIFMAWLDAELAYVERKVEISEKNRAQQIQEIELDQLTAQLTAVQNQGKLANSLTTIALRNAVPDDLRSEMTDVEHFFTQQLYTLARLRYVYVLQLARQAGSTANNNLQKLVDTKWDTSLYDVATAMNNAASAMVSSFNTSALAGGVNRSRVVVRFPRSTGGATALPVVTWSAVDAGRGTSVWTTTDAGQMTSFEVRPEDLYFRDGQRARSLVCTETAPTIRGMVLVGVMPKGSPDPSKYNGGIAPPATISANVEFPTADGFATYQLDPLLRNYKVRVYFFREDEADTKIAATELDPNDGLGQNVADGISPFAEYSVDMAGIKQMFAGRSDNPLPLTVEWLLVFDVETKSAAAPMGWLSGCSSH
jgi:hypothetical protein